MNPDEKLNEMQEELKARFELLPQDLQDVIQSSDYQTKLFELSKKNKLTYEQLGVLELETTFVILGLTKPTDYEKELAAGMKIKTEDLKKVISEVEAEVFLPIRKSLMRLYHEPSDDVSADKPKIDNTEKGILAQSGISLEGDQPQTTPSAPTIKAGDRNDMLKDIENPTKSTPIALNEMPKKVPAPSISTSVPLTKPQGLDIPVPRAPYAGGAPTAEAVKQPIPVDAKPVNIMEGKLGGTFALPKKETDLSIKNIGAAALKTSGDSYREPID